MLSHRHWSDILSKDSIVFVQGCARLSGGSMQVEEKQSYASSAVLSLTLEFELKLAHRHTSSVNFHIPMPFVCTPPPRHGSLAKRDF